MSPSPHPAIVTRRAADWLAKRDAGFTPTEAEAFDRWLASDPAHAAAVAELESAWSTLQRPRDSGHAEKTLADLAARARLRHRRRARQFTWVASGLAAAAALALAFWLPSLSPPVTTGSGSGAVAAAARPEHQTLPDGSVVELNVGAGISVHFSPTRREVRLLRGEAHFAVAKDASRPFIVSAGGVEARAVGTEFLVTFASQDVQVLVTEGRVAVASAAPASPVLPDPILVSAGNRVVVPLPSTARGSPQPTAVNPTQITSALAWRRPRIEFTGTPLSEVIALFNRQNRLQLSLADPTLGELKVSGIFWPDDPAGFVRLLEPAFTLASRRVDADHIEIRR
jgi:transmembrane sensor